MPFQKKSQFKLTFLSLVLIFCICFYSVRIYTLSVSSKDTSVAAASTRTAVLKAPRGEILDCYGRQIAINRDGYNIVFNQAYVGDDLNDVILSLINILSAAGIEWIDRLPMAKTAPYAFTDESTDRLIENLSLAHYATAENCFARMIEKYELENYPTEQQRSIMGVRYSMDISDFSISYPYTFAEDIPTEMMRKISESGFLLSGVTVDVVPFREYTDTSLAVNLIGSVGPIYADDWDNYKDKGYSFNDKVGKSGIEKWGEEHLRGSDGQITYYIDGKGAILSSEVTVAPVAGKTIMLTLDKAIQRTAQDSLATTVRELQSSGGTAVAGTAVVVDVNTGGVITAANYPTYDSATYNQNYQNLISNPSKPLTDRAFQGVYPIGSTIKPAVATAALENGKYQIGETIRCVHTYNYFADYKPSCMSRHGTITLNTAIAKSCNYFFFELGRRVGATTLTDYFKQFGLGVKTGVEVDDSSGILYEPKSDGVGGDTLQISIGQLNAFTPLQLANYTATLANGGTHYRATLIKKVVSYDLSEQYNETSAEVVNTVSIGKNNIDAIKNGMLSVTVDGTGRTTFSNYPLKIGGKTGTSQVTDKADHSIYVVFAPYDNPKIAISVVLEHGSSGIAAGGVVKSILDAYFFNTGNHSGDTQPFQVLK